MPNLRERVASFLSGAFPLPLSLADMDRELLARFLEESARRATSAAARMDYLTFGHLPDGPKSVEDAAWTTPALDQLRAIASAVRAGQAEVAVVPGLDTPQRYSVSGLLETAQSRAQREDAPYAVTDGCGRLWQLWDRWAGCSGSPAERSWHLAGRPKNVIVRD